jgi:hypothetical protein
MGSFLIARHPLVIIPDSAVEIGTCVTIKGRARRSEDTERTISTPSRVLGQGWQFFQDFTEALEIAGRYKPLIHCLRSGGLAA